MKNKLLYTNLVHSLSTKLNQINNSKLYWEKLILGKKLEQFSIKIRLNIRVILFNLLIFFSNIFSIKKKKDNKNTEG